jgi:hypothetical protein
MVAKAAPAQVNLDATIVREVQSERVTYVLRASRLTNLLYELDCLAGVTTSCSREAYEAEWRAHPAVVADPQTALGSWRSWSDDRSALKAWSELHGSRSADNEASSDDVAPSPLPIFAPVIRTARERFRVAAYSADNEASMLDHIGALVGPTDAARAGDVVVRFESRFEPIWLAHREELAKRVDGFAALMTRPDVKTLVESIAHFYDSDLPPHTRETFELLSRPELVGSTYGQQLADLALIETTPKERPEDRLGVVLHELFHRWFASASYAKKRALADAFAASPHPFARCAYGLMNEALAAALGNGLITRAVNPEDFDKSMAKPLRLYNDRFVDPTAKAILPWIEARIAAGKTLYDADFVADYVNLVASAFPKGPAPVLHLRPLVSVYEASLEDVERHFYDVVGGNWIESTTGFDKDAHELLAKHPTWGTAVVLLASHVDQIKGIDKSIDAAAMGVLHGEIAKKAPFVLTIAREKAAPLFVLVAADGGAMRDLMDRFGQLDATTVGVWR